MGHKAAPTTDVGFVSLSAIPPVCPTSTICLLTHSAISLQANYPVSVCRTLKLEARRTARSFLHPSRGSGLLLFTESPRRVLLGNWASGVRGSRKFAKGGSTPALSLRLVESWSSTLRDDAPPSRCPARVEGSS